MNDTELLTRKSNETTSSDCDRQRSANLAVPAFQQEPFFNFVCGAALRASLVVAFGELLLSQIGSPVWLMGNLTIVVGVVSGIIWGRLRRPSHSTGNQGVEAQVLDWSGLVLNPLCPELQIDICH